MLTLNSCDSSKDKEILSVWELSSVKKEIDNLCYILVLLRARVA
jgi:hypothetical protein